MSIEVSSFVWKFSKQSGSRLLLLVALADYTNAEGYAWPSVRSLCQRTRMKERYVQTMLRDLADDGEIQIIERKGHSNMFRVLFSDSSEGCTIAHPRGAPGCGGGVHPNAPRIISRTVIETSNSGEIPKTRPRKRNLIPINTSSPKTLPIAQPPPADPDFGGF